MRIPEAARRSTPPVYYASQAHFARRLLCWSCVLLTLLSLRWPFENDAFGQKPPAPSKKAADAQRPKETEEQKAARRAEKVKAVELGKFNTERHAKHEEEFYTLTPVSIPPEITLEVGGLTWLPKGELGISTRRGEIYVVENPSAVAPEMPKFHRLASGLHEVLGLANRDGWLYATQRGEVTRMKDENGDRRADIFEVYADNWEISGDYHEYAVGSNFDRDGNLYVALCLTGSFGSSAKYRGWCLKITPDGKTIPICSGIRSPGGVGMNAQGDMFYTENQGPWNGTCALKYLKPGGFQGHPAGNVWYQDAPQMGPAPASPKDGSRIATEAARIPELVPSAVLFPYGKMGNSATGIACDFSNGKFGPFANQLFVGDLTQSNVMRVFLEQIDGVYQGACFPFRHGMGSGSMAVLLTPDGTMYVGGTNRGWGSHGTKPFSLDRISWTGKVPFEIKEMRIKPDGFELEFTEPVQRELAADVESYDLETYTYIYQSSYGSPEVDRTHPTIKSATVGADGKSVRLVIDGLKIGHVHQLKAANVHSVQGDKLLHDMAYYTVNKIPKK